ncbi:MAG: Flp pilus assembly protein CpaB [Sedimentisphaerales bacterium]|nr:Flp pilus assembly protein CpaB [Sedimentisphaerales bacterium]
MKWSIAVLITLGLLASLSAAILVKVLRLNKSGALPAETEVVLASQDMPAMSVLESSNLTVKKVPRDKLSAGYLSDTVQAVGKILAVPVVEGQMLTESCFVTEGSSAQIAASLPSGMRAVAVSLTSASISGGLLYPGCVVDVLASFRLPSSSERGEALSTTLLRGINVLAVHGTSVVSKEAEEDTKTSSRPSQGRLTVTLMVDSKQAEALQLAAEHGQISLALRNPLDKAPVDTEAMVLSQGRLAQLGSAMAPVIPGSGDGANANVAQITDLVSASATQADARGASGPLKQPGSKVQQPSDAGNSGKLSWPVTVIRGTQIQQQDLDMPDLETSGSANKS